MGEQREIEDADRDGLQHLHDREKAESRLAAHLGLAKALKDADSRRRARGRRLLRRGATRAPVRAVPAGGLRLRAGLDRRAGGVAESRAKGTASSGSFGTGEERRFAAELPARRERSFQAWVQISMGCNSVCSYCIVPTVRGKQMSRPAEEIAAEVERTGGRWGARDHTARSERQLLRPRSADWASARRFAELLRACDRVDGIERIRFTSPHPKDFRERRDRRHGRVQIGLRARAPAGAIGFQPHPQDDAPYLRSRAFPRSRR